MLPVVDYGLFAAAFFNLHPAWGRSIGVRVWLGVLSAAVLPIVFLLQYRERLAVL